MQQTITLLASHLHGIKQSHIYETKPWGVTEQDTFLNMVIRGETSLSPQELLQLTQDIQTRVGRIKRQTNGPREIDIDILLYGDETVQTADLTIPHPRIQERDFVYVPLRELNPNYDISPTMIEPYILQRHMPTQIVGILNLSPESFGSTAYTDLSTILRRVEQMVDEGADIIDIGAQSTKPGSVQLTEVAELSRLRGVIKAIKMQFPFTPLSVDTTRLACVCLALEEGIDMVNDISGGRFAPEIIPLIIKTDVKIVIMHSRGDFADIHKKYQYGDIITELLNYFQRKIQELLKLGLRPDQIILDPGIGFSKGAKENFAIIGNIEKLKALGFPVYIGLSRKKFIGTATGKDDPLDRDVGSTVLHTLCIQKGADYIRAHNVDCLRDTINVLKNL
jgi:dihydropteroate synthase/2-amino-4-hydroxy-6-hydroxymethyldihydropteridine diphosphokinase